MSAQSKTSALLLSTASVSELVLVSIVDVDVDVPGRDPRDRHRRPVRVLFTSNDWFGTMLVILYGPTPGGGLFGSFFIGVPVGTNPSAGNASDVLERAVRRDQVDHDLCRSRCWS